MCLGSSSWRLLNDLASRFTGPIFATKDAGMLIMRSYTPSDPLRHVATTDNTSEQMRLKGSKSARSLVWCFA